ncbi:MAG TPA: MlaD family protein [Capsulimonadaceae bacterium]|nr:MlaD family protein [Capsulimonadaceae bacterium]
MDTARTALQVGLLVFLAAVLFIIGYYFFFGAVHSQKYYTVTVQFDDAQGIQQGAEVDLAGVKIGEVASVKLSPTNKALVQLRILKGRRIPRASSVTIASSLLGGNANVAITPASPQVEQARGDYQPGDIIRGTAPFGLSSVEAQAGPVLSQLNTTMKKADLLILQATRTAASINKTTLAANRIIGNPHLQQSLADTMANLDQASQQGVLLARQIRTTVAVDNAEARVSLANINSTTGEFRDLAAQNRAKLNRMIASLDQTMATLNQLTAQMNSAVTQGNVAGNLSDTVANLKQATVQLNQIEMDIHSLTSDTQIRSDLKTTIHNAAEASGNTERLVDRLNAIAGGRLGGTGKGALSFEGRLGFTENFRTDKFRTDFDLLTPLSSHDFARLGVFDLTESNKLNLQYGERPTYNSLVDYRAGVYAGKVGIGADYDLFGSDTFSLDLYDPNRLRLDARAHFPFNKQSGLWVGVEDVPRTNGFTLGVELRR